MLKRDSIYFGLLIGSISPLIVFAILYSLLDLAEMIFAMEWLNERPALKLISIAINLLLLRYYFVRLKFENTGRGLLIITFVYVIAYFIIYPPA
jgi:hypothetical protein